MVKFLIGKGPGRFDFMVAYMRGDLGDQIRCMILLDHKKVKQPLEVGMSIKQAVPVIGLHGERDNWEISGALAPWLAFDQSGSWNPSVIPWVDFQGSYGFKTSAGFHGLAQLNLDYDELKAMHYWAKQLHWASRD